MLRAENGSMMCENGDVVTSYLSNVTSSDYEDEKGVSLKNGCCACGGGSGGRKQKVNGKYLETCDDILNIYESYSPETSPGKDIIEACKASPYEANSQSLKDKYKILSEKNEILKKKAKEIFNQIVILRSKDDLLEDEIDNSQIKFNDSLNDYQDLYDKVLKYKSGRMNSDTRDAQWEDIRYKQKSQSLHVLIWAGLAILTILFVLKRMKK